MKIFAHTCFIGTTGYANHARSFFVALNKHHTVKVRNLTIGGGWKGYNNTPHDYEPYITKEMKDMLVQQTLFNTDDSRTDYPIYKYDKNFKPDVHIVLMEMDSYYFYDHYDGYKIAYCVWETTRFPDHFFNKLMEFDEMWVPSKWQRDSLIEQGYPEYKIAVVPEGVDINTFKPIPEVPKKDKFRFLLFGRWDYRKSTGEILKTFEKTFEGMEDKVEMICSIENPYPSDGLTTTQERLKKYDIKCNNLKILDFPPREDYIKYLQEGDVFVSCARSEGWNLPLQEAIACGTPSIYSSWSGQMEFAEGKGIPVKISHLRLANFERKDFTGEYCEPDFEDLGVKMMDSYINYEQHKKQALIDGELIRKEFTWENAAKIACKELDNPKTEEQIVNRTEYVFVTTGNEGYMRTIEKLVQSIQEFSKSKIIVYGVYCDVPFDYPNVIKRRIDPPQKSEHDKWYWKQYACLESLNENYENFVWIDGDVVINHNFDNIKQYFKNLKNYPLSDIHVQSEFFGYYEYEGVRSPQLFGERLCEDFKLTKTTPLMHVCMYVYNKKCDWWFKEIIETYNNVKLEEYSRLYLWNDEGMDNMLRWKYGYRDHLPLSNYDTSGYDGDGLNQHTALHQFYKFCNEDGPQNFNRIFGYQVIPKDKSDIIYFHGNKNPEFSDKMIEFIKFTRDKNFYQSEYFYTDIYVLKNLGEIKEVPGGTWEIAQKYGWDYAVYHEIFNLRDYYLNRERRIFPGDVVVDLGANIGVFNRWAYSEGASKVISFEPDKRYFDLLSLNSDPRSILFNAAISDKMGEDFIHESPHLGGSSLFDFDDCLRKYKVRTYTLDYLFDSGLIDKIDFMKIDIEGGEIGALKGISDKNLRKVKAISMEYHHQALNRDNELREQFIQRLIKNGFNSHVLFLGSNEALQMIYFWK